MLRFLAVLLAVLTGIGAFAGQVGPAEGDQLLMAEVKQLNGVADLHLGASGEPGKGQAFLYFYCGGAYSDLLAICNPPTNVKQFAAALQRAAAGTPLQDADFLYSVEQGSGIVHANASSGKLFEHSAEVTWNLLSFRDASTSTGFATDALMRLPLYGTISATGYDRCETARSRYLLLRAASSASPIQFRAQTPPLAVPAAAALLFLPFLGASLGLGGGVLIARNQAIDLDRRRRLYKRFVYGGVFGSMFIHAPLFTILMIGGWTKPMLDLWLGTRMAVTIAPVIMGGVIPLFIALPFVLKEERKLMAPKDPSRTGIPPARELSAGEKLASRHAIYWRLGVLAATLVLGLVVIASTKSRIAMPIFIFVIAAEGQVMSAFDRRRTKSAMTEEPCPEWEQEATWMAGQLGPKLRTVVVTRGGANRRSMVLTVDNQKLKIPERVFEVLTPSEVRFYIAHALTQPSREQQTRQSLVIMCCSLPLAAAFMAATFYAGNNVTVRMGIWGVLLLAVPFAFLKGQSVRSRRGSETYKQALRITCDYPAARSAVIKVALAAPMPGFDDPDKLPPGSNVARMVADLDKTAAELGMK